MGPGGTDEKPADAAKTMERVFGSVTEGLLILDHEWRLTYVNAGAAKLLHQSREGLRGQICWQILPESLKATLHSEFNRAVGGNLSIHVEAFCPDPIDSWLEFSCYPTSEGLTVFFRDVTGRKRSEEEWGRVQDAAKAIESEAQQRAGELDAVLESMADGLIIYGPDLKILRMNSEAQRMLGYSPEEFRMSFGDRVAFMRATVCEEFRQIPVENFPISRASRGETVKGMEVCFNPRGTEKTIWVSTSAAPIRTADGRQIGSVATFIDITERKQAERELKQLLNQIEQERRRLEERVRERTAELEKTYASLERREEELRYLSSKLLSAHEEERKRIAREIHDSLGASLSAIKMKIESTLQRLEQDVPPVVARTFEALLPVVKEGLDESRRIQTDLRPAILDDIGILSTIAWFCKRFEANSGIRVDQEIKIREEDVPDRLKIVIYRIIQEAMNNIGKYSKADLVVIAFQEIGNRIELVIRDNGGGFDPEEVLSRESTRRGLGLSSMKERAELSGGLFEIETGQGRGTTVRASWPIS